MGIYYKFGRLHNIYCQHQVIIINFNISFDAILPNIFATLYEGLVGFIISIIFALILAIFMDIVPLIKKAVYPMLVISQTVPIIALAPLFIMWFGFGIVPKIIVVVFVCFFPIVISIIDGLV